MPNAWMSRVLPNCAALAQCDPERTIFTHFTPPMVPEEAEGAWRQYYERWRHATRDRLGIGMAVHEETPTDHRFGRFMYSDLGEYHVPGRADIDEIEVIFLEEHDDKIFHWRQGPKCRKLGVLLSKRRANSARLRS